MMDKPGEIDFHMLHGNEELEHLSEDELLNLLVAVYRYARIGGVLPRFKTETLLQYRERMKPAWDKKMQTKDIPAAAVIEACRKGRASKTLRSFDFLQHMYPMAPEKVLIRAMEREERIGTIEFGVSLACAWPVED